MENLNLDEIWDRTLEILKTELSKKAFDTWLKSTRLLNFEGSNMVIGIPNQFAQEWLQDRYYNIIKSTLQLITNEENLDLSFALPGSKEYIKFNKVQKESSKNYNIKNKNSSLLELPLLNSKYTFDSFVIGNNNRFAHAASLAVAETPAKAYNPLFIYGGVGLGKTHLMHAIGHYVMARNPNSKVLYVTSEKFTNELINSIKDDQTVNFRNRYRTIDVLLIDDIQFLKNKISTQEEFFHTFNTLYEANKQIVISSDRPPKEIPTLEDRLRSRFEWGLMTDIQAPDLETRIAILRKKAFIENIELPNDVMYAIATKIESNIRELEGGLIKVAAYAQLTNKEINENLVDEALKDLVPINKPVEVTISIIQEKVSRYFNLRIEDFKAKKRTRNIAFPRQIAMYLSRELTDSSLPKIGHEFGGRDHTTVIHACEKISEELKFNSKLSDDLKAIIQSIKSH